MLTREIAWVRLISLPSPRNASSRAMVAMSESVSEMRSSLMSVLDETRATAADPCSSQRWLAMKGWRKSSP